MRFFKDSDIKTMILVGFVISLLVNIILKNVVSGAYIGSIIVVFSVLAVFAEKRLNKISNEKIKQGTFKIKRAIDNPARLETSQNLRFLRFWNIYIFSIYYLARK